MEIIGGGRPVASHSESPKPVINPLAVWANWYYFKPGEVVRFSRVESVCLLWPIRGTGTVISAGQTFQLEAGSILVLPWNHDIEYRAASKRPFQLGTIHLIPDYRGAAADLSIRVNVEPTDFLADYMRFDDHELSITKPAIFPAAAEAPRSLIELGNYTIRMFQNDAASYDLLTALGKLFSRELSGLQGRNVTASKRLTILQDYILQNLARDIRIDELAGLAACSVSAVERSFQNDLGVSPKAWIARQRMRQALFLLESTSLNVSEVAFQVGFKDPLYFSKVFKQHFGSSPRNYLSSKIATRAEYA